MDKFMQQMREAFANEALWKEFQTGIWDTIYSTVAATLVACVLGIILGIILVAGEEDGVRPLPGPVMKVLNFAINILRSVPFLILMVVVIPLSRLILGTSIGTVATIVTSGYHRTKAEMEKKNNTHSAAAGIDARFAKAGFHAGLTAVYTRYDRDLRPDTATLYRLSLIHI